jgi:hypothetical protein
VLHPIQFKGKVKSQSFYPGKGMRDHETFEELVAASNPALQTVRRDAWCSHWFTLVCLLRSILTHRCVLFLPQFKGKVKSQSFYPGKGMRDHESFEELVAASNPALQTVRSHGSDALSAGSIESNSLPSRCSSRARRRDRASTPARE